MSLTEINHIFAGVDQPGINTFLRAVFAARPHYLNYGSSAFNMRYRLRSRISTCSRPIPARRLSFPALTSLGCIPG
jgi:hypothetical protein